MMSKNAGSTEYCLILLQNLEMKCLSWEQEAENQQVILRYVAISTFVKQAKVCVERILLVVINGK